MKHALLIILCVTTSIALRAQYIQTFPFTEDFESSTNCGTTCGNACVLSNSDFTNDLGDDSDWTVDDFGTGSGGTGPTADGGADHNPGTSGGNYLYIETSGSCSGGDVSNLVSPYFDLTSITTPYVEFWFHMNGATMGTMHFDIDTTQGASWDMDYIPSWTDNLDDWQQQIISMVEFAGMDSVRFRVRSVSGSSFTSDMAVDDFTVGDTVFAIDAIVITPDCDGDVNGSIIANTLFGLEPISYNWSNSSTNDTIDNLAEGTYSLTVTDANGNTATETFVLDVPAIVTTTTVLQDQVCSYDTASAAVSASGGTPITDSYVMDTNSFNYNPDTIDTNNIIVNLGDDQLSGFLPIGFDFVFFGDTFDDFRISSNGFMTFDPTFAGSGCCSGQNLPNGTAPNAVIALNWEDLDPDNGNDGTISHKTIGTAPLRTCIVTFEDVAYFGGSFGDVSVQVKLFESTNCVEIHTIDVVSDGTQTQGIENLAGDEGYTYPGRNAASWSGSGDFVSFCPTVNGLSYLWSNGSTDTLIQNLSQGTYTVTVTDANGCFVTDSVIIGAPQSDLSLSPVTTDVTCFGLGDGTVITNPANGSGALTFAWNDGSTTEDLSATGPGTYSVVATDALGCVDSVSGLVVIEPPILVSAVTNIVNASCPDSTDGAASIIGSGGVPPYTYAWQPIGAGGNSISNVLPGTYQGIVIDANGCQSIQSVAILANFPAPMPNLGLDIFNPGGSSATLDPGSNFDSYTWSTGATTQTITVSQTGSYSVVVTNSFGCSANDSVFVEIWPTGVDDIENDAVRIFPNPVVEALNVDFAALQGSGDLTLTVINLRGQVVATQVVTDRGMTTVDVSSLASGVYKLNVKGEDVNIHQRFVKQ